MTPRTRSLLGLAAWIAVTFAAAAAAGLASTRADELYGLLRQPVWAPPSWVFAPVWNLLYLAMAIAAWLVWRERGFAGARGALTLYLVQLAANALWSWLFFAWRMGAAASVETVVLLLLIAATLANFWRVRPLAGALLIPYLAWVGYATALTIALWRMNPQVLG